MIIKLLRGADTFSPFKGTNYRITMVVRAQLVYNSSSYTARGTWVYEIIDGVLIQKSGSQVGTSTTPAGYMAAVAYATIESISIEEI